MADPVSWLLIEPGWRVLDASGNEVGRVEAVTGDSNADVFDGLAVAANALAAPRYVPAEQVAEITDGAVRLALDADALESLPGYEEPPAAIEVDADGAPALERAEETVVPPSLHPHRPPLLRRVATWFGLAGRR